MNDRYNLISNKGELKRFHDYVLPPLKEGEVYFLSLSARAKYLTLKQRSELSLGRTEMFCRNIVRTKEYSRFFRTLKKLEVAYGGYTTKNGSEIPESAMVVYMNINPSSTLKAYTSFSSKMNEYMRELAICAQEGRSTKDISYRMSKMDTLLMNCYQQSTGTKHWLDIDFDIDKRYFDPVVTSLTMELRSRNIRHVVIETRSGYHVMIDRHTLNYNYTESVKNANVLLLRTYAKDYNVAIGYDEMTGNGDTVKKRTGMEIVVNKNAMVPMPGTYQAGFPVKILTNLYGDV